MAWGNNAMSWGSFQCGAIQRREVQFIVIKMRIRLLKKKMGTIQSHSQS